MSDTEYEVVAAIRSIRSHSVVSLVVLLWDFLLTMDDEVRWIWSMKRCPIKWLYLFLRYFPLTAQIFHQIVLPDLSGSDILSPLGCKLWYAYMITVIQVTNIALELILALRVAALFGGHRWVFGLLGCIMAVEVLCALPSVWTGIPYYQHCILFTLSPVVQIQAAAALVAQTTFVCMTLCRIFFTDSGFLRTTIVFQFARDGIIAYFAIMVLICCGFFTIKLHWQPAILFFWAVTVRSISGTRLILSMARLRRGEVPQESENILFTTQIDVSANFTPEGGVNYGPSLASIQNIL